MRTSTNLIHVGQILQDEAGDFSSRGVDVFIAHERDVVGEGLDVPGEYGRHKGTKSIRSVINVAASLYEGATGSRIKKRIN